MQEAMFTDIKELQHSMREVKITGNKDNWMTRMLS